MRLARFAVSAAKPFLSLPMGRRLLTVFYLVGSLTITALLFFHVKDPPYPLGVPTGVGIALALLIGGIFTFATTWVSITFGGSGGGEGSGDDVDPES